LQQLKRREKPITGIRLTSLCFWYFYVDVISSNKPRISGSDIGDIYQSSFIPYSSVFTADRTMSKILGRVRQNDFPNMCKIMTKNELANSLKIAIS
jgi:hypothetical protein